MHNVYLTVGSNINPEHHLRQALRRLKEICMVIQASPVYETAPVGYLEQDHFLNAAFHVQTEDDPVTFKTKLLAIETQLGRVRDPNNKNAPRTIDLDIALWDDAVFDYGEKGWHIPDPDILRFIHVARPLADLAPEMIHPETGEILASIANGLPSDGLVKRDDFLWE